MFNPAVNRSNPGPIHFHVPNTESQAQLEKIKRVIKSVLLGLIVCLGVALLFGGISGSFLLGFHLLTLGWGTILSTAIIISGTAATVALATYIFSYVCPPILEQVIAHRMAAEAYYTPIPAKPEEMYHG